MKEPRGKVNWSYDRVVQKYYTWADRARRRRRQTGHDTLHCLPFRPRRQTHHPAVAGVGVREVGVEQAGAHPLRRLGGTSGAQLGERGLKRTPIPRWRRRRHPADEQLSAPLADSGHASCVSC